MITRSIVVKPFGKRPLWPALVVAGLMGALVVNGGLVVAGSQIGLALQVLVGVGIHLIPPVVWPGMVFIVALWVVVMRRVWRG